MKWRHFVTYLWNDLRNIVMLVVVFIAVICNLVVTSGDAHWVELLRPQRWAGVRACPPRR